MIAHFFFGMFIPGSALFVAGVVLGRSEMIRRYRSIKALARSVRFLEDQVLRLEQRCARLRKLRLKFRRDGQLQLPFSS